MCYVVVFGLLISLFLTEANILNTSDSTEKWVCRDGSEVQLSHRCDGVVNCSDGSDETHAECWANKCKRDEFRCTYGACVNGTATCDGAPTCRDLSDELLPKCRNEHLEQGDIFKCTNGRSIPFSARCDGSKDCADGSDETLWVCAGMHCPAYLFQCEYGACVDSAVRCNKIRECADGSDESEDLCSDVQKPASESIQSQDKCILPPYPANGTYITDKPLARPGDALDFIAVNITCHPGYAVNGTSTVYCISGWWSENIASKCISQCTLTLDPFIEYQCVFPKPFTGTRPCNEREPTGTVVRPSCQHSTYSPTALREMQCVNGTWNYVPKCIAGLKKNETVITILVKDNVEVSINNRLFVIPINNSYVYVHDTDGTL